MADASSGNVIKADTKEKPGHPGHKNKAGPGEEISSAVKEGGPVALDTSFAVKEAQPLDPKKESQELADVRKIARQYAQDITAAAFTWLTNCTINNDRAAGERVKPDDSKLNADKKNENPEEAQLGQLPYAQPVKNIIETLLPQINAQITREIKAGLNPKPLLDQKKLEAEWAEGKFGPESRKAWKASCDYLSKEVTNGLAVLDARGFPLTNGLPVALPKDGSGSGRLESPQLFREKLRAGQIKLNLGEKELASGELPGEPEIVQFINAKISLERTEKIINSAEKIGQARFLSRDLKTLQIADKPLTDWLKLQGSGADGATIDGVIDRADKDLREAVVSGDNEKLTKVVELVNKIQDWSSAVIAWRDPAVAVEHYASVIASLNAATRTDGKDWPSVTNLRHYLAGKIPADMGTFSDHALQPGVFPGTVVRNTDHTLKSATVSMPENLDRSNIDNLKLNEAQLKWLAENAPAVDRLLDEVAKDNSKDGVRVLCYAEVDGNAPPGDRHAPEKDQYNAYVVGFTAKPCRQDGTLDENGDFYKINSYKEYVYNRWYAFYEADYLGSVEKVKRVSLDPPRGANGSDGLIIGKNDSMCVLDGERIKLVQGRHLPEWLAIKQEDYSSDRAVNMFIDAGFAATGLTELKAYRAALAMGEVGSEFEFIAMRSLAYKKMAHATWSGGLAASGVFRQAISNNIPYGDTLLAWRDKAVEIDMSAQIVPGLNSWQSRAGNLFFGETEMAASFFKKANVSSSLFGKAVDAAHVLYTGGESNVGRWLGGFAWVDYSMYYEHGAGTLNYLDKRSHENSNSSLEQKLTQTAFERTKPYKPSDQTFYVDLGKSDKTRPESAQPALYGAFDQYSQYLAQPGQSNEPLMVRAEQVLSLLNADTDKQKLLDDSARAFLGGDDREKTAGAIICLAARKADNLNEQFGTAHDATAGRMIEYLKTQTLQSPDAHIRLAAADALMRISNQYAGARQTAEDTARQINGQYMQLQSQRLAQLKVSVDKLQLTKISEEHKKTRNTGPLSMSAVAPATRMGRDEEQRLAALGKQIADEKEKLGHAVQKSADIDQFYAAGKVDYADMATVCLGVLTDPKASEQQQIDALVTKTGLRLDLSLDSIRNEVEPQIHRLTDSRTSREERANLYGRDSQTLEATLRGVVTDSKTDPDVKALCMQVLAANSPPLLTIQIKNKDGTESSPLKIGTETVLGRNSLVTGQGVQINHAQARISAGGDIQISPIKDAKGVVSETWIVRANGQKEKLEYEWTQLQNGDQIILGDQEKGAALQLGDDRWQRFADLRKAAEEASIPEAPSASFTQQLTGQLQSSLNNKTPLSPAAVSARWDKYLAAQSALASGFETLNNDNKQMVAATLAQCIESNMRDLAVKPDLAIKAMSLLNNDLVSTLTPEQRDTLQDNCLSILSNLKNTAAINNLKTLTAQHLPAIFTGANETKMANATTTLEGLLVNNSGNSYPLRVATMQTLSEISPERASIVAGALLTGGEVDDLPVQIPGIPVRAAALGVLEQQQPDNLHALVVKALETETDPAIIGRLYNIEYTNRPDQEESIKELQELQAIRHRLDNRFDLSSIKEGKEKVDSLTTHGLSVVPTLYDQAEGKNASVQYNFYHPEAKKARQGLVYLASQDNISAAANLARMCQGKDVALARELSGPLEAALQSNPQMSAQTRLHLVDAYMALTPVKKDPLAQEEKALVLLTALQDSIRNMPRTPYNNPAEYNTSLKLQTNLLAKLHSMPLDKMVPVLASLAQGSGTKAMDNFDRPTSVRYGVDTVRNFSYVSNDPVDERVQRFGHPYKEPGNKKVESFVEQRTGQEERTFKLIGNDIWQDENGEKIFNVRVVTESGRTNFDDRLGDLSYTDDQDVSHIFRTNGSHIETRKDLDGDNIVKVVKITYPGGQASREFVLSGNRNDIESNAQKMKVTDTTNGKTEIWTGEGDNFRTANGKRAINAGTLPGYPPHLTLHPLQIERGDFTYIQDGVQHVFDSSGAEYKIENGVTVLVKQPDSVAFEGSAHPMQNVRAYAAMVLAKMNKSARLNDVDLLYPDTQVVQTNAADIDYQRAYEGIKQIIIHGQEQARLANWADCWEDICRRDNFNLLYRDGFKKAQDNAVEVAEQQRGTLTRFFSGEDKQLQEQARRDTSIPLWKQYSHFLDLAKKSSESSPSGQELRRAVVGNIFDNCRCIPEDQQRAMAESIDTLCFMSKPGHGDFVWAMAACLTEKPDLPSNDQSKLIDALAGQVTPRGNLTLADAADIMRISLEQSYRAMPGSDKPKERLQSIALQEKKLAKLQEWGNVNHLPFITILAQEHNDPVIQGRAAQARTEILRRSRLSARRETQLSSAGKYAAVSSPVEFVPINDP